MSDATDSRLKIDFEKNRIRMIVYALFNDALHDYVAYSNKLEVMDNLFKFFENREITLINKAELRELQALKEFSKPLLKR